jgi:hypothetical protein
MDVAVVVELRQVAGRTKTVQLRAGSRLDKFQREVDTYKEFRSLLWRQADGRAGRLRDGQGVPPPRPRAVFAGRLGRFGGVDPTAVCG